MIEKHAIRFDEARAFLVEAALPLWTTRGVYDNGCFVEHFDLAANPVDPGYTRIRAQARQIYVLCHADVAGLYQSRDVADRAIEFFIASAWLGPDRGWARRISRHGALIDPTSDLYEISFAMFALAWRYRVAPDPRLLAIAHQTLDFLDARMKHLHGGYHNDSEASAPRQQNPHMHLTEAMNAWFEASGDARFIALAGELVDLLERRLTDPRTGALGEFFEDDWTPVAGLKGDLVEPGHQFEWAWIVGHYGRLSGKPRHDLMRRLIASGLLHGYDAATGLTIDQVGRDGRPIATSRRLWPQTEALKAMLAAGEFLDAPEPRRVAAITSAILDRYLKPAPVPGAWIDHFDGSGTAIVNKIPATSLYHVALAFFELLRLRASYEAASDSK
jgi:mannose/cellobiose epimerase-like protein (N-acyl-D-glucosamine 2-epimerase family)